MYLLIDNSQLEQISLFVWLNNKWIQHIYPAEIGLLSAISQCLQEESKNITDVLGIAVVVGVGSFTSTRIAVTVANTLAYALNIKVVAIKSSDEVGVIEKIQQANPGVFISAVYSGEPNIGGKKK